MPPVPTYQPLVPFFPPSLVSGNGSASSAAAVAAASGDADWMSYPDRLDLHFYQGDDVQIPLYFQNLGDPDLDMSNENGYTWKSQIRLRHHYASRLVNEFTIESEAVPPTPPDTEPTGITLVTLFLPRMLNQYLGVYQWDIQSTSPFTGPDFPKPPDVDDANWPMTDQVKTWLYGYVYIVPRLTATDYLPIPPGAAGNNQQVWVVSSNQLVAGANGRVP
jgi:hypothetical protein